MTCKAVSVLLLMLALSVLSASAQQSAPLKPPKSFDLNGEWQADFTVNNSLTQFKREQVMVQHVMTQSDAPAAGHAEWVRDVCSLVRGAAGYVLTVGDLDSAVATVRECLERPAIPAEPSTKEDRHGRRQD